MDLFGEPESIADFEFDWPRPCQLESIGFEIGTNIAGIKLIANQYNCKGIQIKLSNGSLSPIFEQSWSNRAREHHLIERKLSNIGCQLRGD